MTAQRASRGGRRAANGVATGRRWYRIPLDLGDRLAEQAQARDVSENLLVVRAIEQYLDGLPPVPPPGPSAPEMLEQATAALDALGRGE